MLEPPTKLSSRQSNSTEGDVILKKIQVPH